MYAAAVELSKAQPAENKQLTTDFAQAQQMGKVKEFVNYNLGHDTSDKTKFYSNASLIREWAEYARQKPGVPASPPWLFERRRPAVLKTLFESTIVPNEFKLGLLHKAGLL